MESYLKILLIHVDLLNVVQKNPPPFIYKNKFYVFGLQDVMYSTIDCNWLLLFVLLHKS